MKYNTRLESTLKKLLKFRRTTLILYMFNLITANMKIVSYLRSMLLILTIFPLGCVTTSKITITNPIAEKNKDVLILASLIHGHLKSTNERGFNLNDLAQNDTLRRISNNFERAELKTRGGYISVYYWILWFEWCQPFRLDDASYFGSNDAILV